ncbi:MAG: 16S rRNA (cytosine(1402)-N(4))-methyltransferase RsmH [Candidatus Latescibacterota bacterium]|nr:MAG: 16S rRNA (cytosine(1402)-N(4))-methyltransferase RsmH [Candidatus Latescibacterota bacterium]
MHHVPVMVEEVLRYLVSEDSRLILDGTVSCGGHARAILESHPHLKLIGIDRDGDAIRVAERILESYAPRVRFFRGNYTDTPRFLGEKEMLDGVLLDLGLSSFQLDDPSRGFSYLHDGSLDMRMSKEGITAKLLVEKTSETELTRIIRQYGEVTGARKIARAIKNASELGEMESTFDLKRAVETALGTKTTPAVLSKVFQAIRVALNKELDNVESFLGSVLGHMNSGGRLVVISYHSLEDRLVKGFFKKQSTSCVCPPEVPVCVCGHRATLEVLTRRVVKPSAAEVSQNPRARSARLRAAKVIN